MKFYQYFNTTLNSFEPLNVWFPDMEDPQDSSAVRDNSTCIFRNTEPNVVTFFRDQPIKEDVVEFTSGTALVGTRVLHNLTSIFFIYMWTEMRWHFY